MLRTQSGYVVIKRLKRSDHRYGVRGEIVQLERLGRTLGTLVARSARAQFVESLDSRIEYVRLNHIERAQELNRSMSVKIVVIYSDVV
jgi:hypothetical protein